MSTDSWSFDPTHSSVGFTVRHMVISKVHGRFTRWGGSLALDASGHLPESIDVSVEIGSIDTQEAQRDGHLRSADFFDAEKFPAMTFKSTSVERTGADTARVHGDLTIRDVTRPVALEVELGGVGTDPWGGTRAGFSAKTSINRKDFGLGWNVALEAGGLLVGEKVDITIEIEAVKAKPTA
jgi:polyisoprenoid-binding protein YceI